MPIEWGKTKFKTYKNDEGEIYIKADSLLTMLDTLAEHLKGKSYAIEFVCSTLSKIIRDLVKGHK